MQKTWLEDTDYVTLQVTVSDNSKDLWILSFPKASGGLTRYSCTSSSGRCAITPQQACSSSMTADNSAGVEAMSIVPASSACSAGNGAASSADGTSLSYGLKVSQL